MRLPLIKKIGEFIEEKDVDYILETIETLEMLSEIPSIKDEELDVIGELISNLYGAIKVQKAIDAGSTQKDALNDFMKRVVGSIDKG